MEDRLRLKTQKLVKRPLSRPVANSSQPGSSKTSPLDPRHKLSGQVAAIAELKKSNKRFSSIANEPHIRPYTGSSHHRRIKSDPIPSSPYDKKTSTKPLQKHPNPSNTVKTHRRTRSGNESLKKIPSAAELTIKNSSQDRNKLKEIIKGSFSLGIPLTTTVDFYEIGKPLGKGAFGKVYLGIHKLSGLNVAIKTIEKTFMQDERMRKKVFQEVYIMNKVNDKNVIRFLELFESQRHLMIVLEYAGGGDLLQLLRSRGKLSEREARPIFKQLIDAVIACHNEEVIHRDIKLDNILLNKEMTLIKLCDFGVSRVAKRGVKINEQCGTPAYLAPEIIVNEGYEPFFVDVWSMGILLYALISATVPFKAKTVPELHKIILKGKYEFPENFSQHVKDFIAEMLNPVPHLRIKLSDMKSHAWFAQDTMDSEFDASMHGDHMKKHKCIVEALNEFGFPSTFVENSLKNKEINHATASYNLLNINIIE